MTFYRKRLTDWLIAWVKVLHPTRDKIGHFGDIPQANLMALYGKAKPNTTKHTFTNQKKYATIQNKHKKLKPGLVVSYDIQNWKWISEKLQLKWLHSA